MAGNDLQGVIVVCVGIGILTLIVALSIAGHRAEDERRAFRAGLHYRQVLAEQQLIQQAALGQQWNPGSGSVPDPARELAITRQLLGEMDLADRRKELRRLRAGSLDW
ncbi:MAG: hypothetical protein ACR2P2_02480 [Nakamurella sp.]